jgi:hypothetical protein
MTRNRQRLVRTAALILSLLGLPSVLPGQIYSQVYSQFYSDVRPSDPVTSDWSHQHVIFSHPATAEQATRLEKDPRYQRRQNRNSARLSGVATGSTGARSNTITSTISGRDGKLNRDWSRDLGSGAKLGATNYPAKYSLQTSTANCAGAPQPDFVVYGTGLVGSATQASIAAYDNLYSGCTGTVPTVYWAYNTGGTVTTSPVFSRDGTQVAFVQTDGAGHGMLVLLKWAASNTETIGNPMTLTRTPNVSYPGCIAPCMTTTVLADLLGTLHADTNSSVFYDYANDIAYIGDDAGWLHKIGTVFNGVPGEVRNAGWPVQLNPGAPTPLTSPVYDSGSGRVFVADAGGFLYRVGPGTASVASSAQLDFSLAEGGTGFVQGPIVDSTAGVVYAFASSDGSGGCVGGSDCTAVYELNVNFPGGDAGGEAVVGASTFSGTAPNPLYIGAFDSAYENSADPPTGNLYVCGNTGGPPILYQVPVVSGAFGTVIAGPILSNSTTPCSPVSDVLNPNAAGGPTEWIFASAESNGTSTACAAGGCIYNFTDTPWKPLTAYSVGQEILDTHFQIQVVSTAGTSGSAAPGWSPIIGRSTTDATVHWLNQGGQSAFTPPAWKSNHAYALHTKILDGNKNVQFVTTAGTSSGTIPTFSTTPGAVTSDGGTLKWTNLGAIATTALPAAGGTSGIVIDNTVSSGTQAGASQVYFSTLSNQACADGTGGCAVQASQSALQ